MEGKFEPPTEGLYAPKGRGGWNNPSLFLGVVLMILLLTVIFFFGKRMGAKDAELLLNNTRKELVEERHKAEKEKKAISDDLRACKDLIVKKDRESADRIAQRFEGMTRLSRRKSSPQPPVLATRTAPPSVPAPKPTQRIVTGKTVMIVNKSSKELKVYEVKEDKEKPEGYRQDLLSPIPANSSVPVGYEGHHGILLYVQGEGVETSPKGEDFSGPGPWVWTFDAKGGVRSQ